MKLKLEAGLDLNSPWMSVRKLISSNITIYLLKTIHVTGWSGLVFSLVVFLESNLLEHIYVMHGCPSFNKWPEILNGQEVHFLTTKFQKFSMLCRNTSKLQDMSNLHYVIKFVSDLWQVGGFLWFPPPIKLIATI